MDCLPSHPDIFRSHFTQALQKCRSHSPSHTHSPASTAPEGLVTSLGEALQEIVRSIQLKQAALKASLRGPPVEERGPHITTTTASMTGTSLLPEGPSEDSGRRKGGNEGGGLLFMEDTCRNAAVVRSNRPSTATANGTGGHSRSKGNCGGVGASRYATSTRRVQHRSLSHAGTGRPLPTALSGAGEDEEEWELQEAIRLSLGGDREATPPPPQHRPTSRDEAMVVTSNKQQRISTLPSYPPSPPLPVTVNMPMESCCLLCGEEFDSEQVLCGVGRCNHACICGVSGGDNVILASVCMLGDM